MPLNVDVQDASSVIDGPRRSCALWPSGLPGQPAGIGSDIPFLQTTLETFDRISVNLRGTFIVGQAARTMKETGGGSIVNISSVSGITGNAGRSPMAHPSGASSV